MHKRQYTDEFRQQAVARTNAGEQINAVAKDLKIHPSMLSKWRKKAPKSNRPPSIPAGPIKFGNGNSKHDQATVLKIIARHKAGERVRVLAKETGISYHTIYTWLNKYKNMPTGPATNGANPDMATLNLQGVVHDAIVYLREVRKYVMGEIRSGKKAEMDHGHLHALLALSELEKVAR